MYKNIYSFLILYFFADEYSLKISFLKVPFSIDSISFFLDSGKKVLKYNNISFNTLFFSFSKNSNESSFNNASFFFKSLLLLINLNNFIFVSSSRISIFFSDNILSNWFKIFFISSSFSIFFNPNILLKNLYLLFISFAIFKSFKYSFFSLYLSLI